MAVVKVQNVSIIYQVGDFKQIGLKDFVIKKIKKDFIVKKFVAVNNVSFELNKGDFLAIVGTNGAGKSTLLKAVSQIMKPSKGTVEVNGKIVAFLELASGFDGELTVKENAYLRGAMLGYTREFMNKKYEEIIDFSELKEFEDRQFKHLSSGMKSRLAFAIAALVEPEILILDEVLSVGDGAFKVKSEAKMQDIIQNGVVTILVSHSLEQVRRMANKVLWLDHGNQIMFGETKEVCDLYEEFLRTKKLPVITGNG